MKERGMIFNAEMVRAILDGRKTQTRRIVKPQRVGDGWSVKEAQSPLTARHTHDWWLPTGTRPYSALPGCPYGVVGDRIWVRETFATLEPGSYEPVKPQQGYCQEIRYAATDRLAKSDSSIRGYKWIPSLHMPRWASRITLEITGVRVERLNSISEEDAKAEGAPTECCIIGDKHFLGFRSLWKDIYGDDSFQANPWVWVIEFKRVEGGAA